VENPTTTESRVQSLSWVAVLEALESLPCRIQLVVVVVDVTFHYILPRIPSSPTFFLLLVAFLL
jgi:hypothetical protein